jgi:hydrogenase nickel incorporation protein HypA/HybF
MHELAIASCLLESVEEHARRIGATKVVGINLTVGERSGVVDDSLRYCFDLLAAGTLIEGARINLERTRMSFRCPACSSDYCPVAEFADFACPRCGRVGKLLDDASEVRLASLEVET